MSYDDVKDMIERDHVDKETWLNRYATERGLLGILLGALKQGHIRILSCSTLFKIEISHTVEPIGYISSYDFCR